MTLDEFLDDLAGCRDYEWYVNLDGDVRARHGYCRLCPITALYLKKTGKFLPSVYFHEAGASMGLCLPDSDAIADAADGRGHVSLRQRILEVIGLPPR